MLFAQCTPADLINVQDKVRFNLRSTRGLLFIVQEGWGAIHYAARSGNAGILALLLKHGADPSLQNMVGVTHCTATR